MVFLSLSLGFCRANGGGSLPLQASREWLGQATSHHCKRGGENRLGGVSFEFLCFGRLGGIWVLCECICVCIYVCICVCICVGRCVCRVFRVSIGLRVNRGG